MIFINKTGTGRWRIFLFVSLALFTSSLYTRENNYFEDSDHCVAYEAGKRMFLVSNQNIIGKNCSITTTAKGSGANVIITMKAPLNKFVSGEPERDKHVIEILRGEQRDHIKFISDPVKRTDLTEASDGSIIHINGLMYIGNAAYNVESDARFTTQDGNMVITGKIETKFSNFDIPPPSIGGGIIVKVSDDLTLHYHLILSDIDGL